MRIPHTSNLHLSENKPETLEALKEILRVAKIGQIVEATVLTVTKKRFVNTSSKM